MDTLRTNRPFMPCLSVFAAAAVFFFSPGQANAQPHSDIFVFDIALDHQSNIALFKAVNTTARQGYDNQPYFANGWLYYSSVKDGKQADIYAYNLKNGRTRRLTNTPESEFSPQEVPGRKGTLSVVRVELDSTQKLWQLPLKGKKGAAPVATAPEPVGYTCWAGPGKLVMFVLGQPNTLQLLDLATGKTQVLDENPGRCLQRIPGSHKISYVKKNSDGQWAIRTLDPQTLDSQELVPTLPDAEDYAWAAPDLLLMGKGSILYKNDLAKGSGWEEVGDLLLFGIARFDRIAIDPAAGKMAVTVLEAE